MRRGLPKLGQCGVVGSDKVEVAARKLLKWSMRRIPDSSYHLWHVVVERKCAKISRGDP